MKKTWFAALALALVLGACDRGGSISDEIDKQEKAAAAEEVKVKAANDLYLAANKAKPGVMTTASGLQYKVLRQGDAKLAPPGPMDQVSVMYEGKLTSGKVFDSAYARGEPVSFVVTGVIPGWTEALQMMHPGDMYELTIPPDLGYGASANGPIPANSILLFKVELLGYQRAGDGKVVKAQ
jgi:FKBP-type peptidyl-prolyl cis-trans isomerase